MPMKTKEEQREYQRIWMQKRRNSWIEANGPCQMCGSSDRLEVDHKDASTKLYAPAALWSMSDKNPKKVAELAKCWVLCHGCHKSKSKESGDLGKNPVKGSENKMSKVTEEIVLAIRAEYVPGQVTQKELGEKYGIARNTVSQIITRTWWKHI